MCQVLLGEEQQGLQMMVCKRVRSLAKGAIGAMDLWHDSPTSSLSPPDVLALET